MARALLARPRLARVKGIYYLLPGNGTERQTGRHCGRQMARKQASRPADLVRSSSGMAGHSFTLSLTGCRIGGGVGEHWMEPPEERSLGTRREGRRLSRVSAARVMGQGPGGRPAPPAPAPPAPLGVFRPCSVLSVTCPGEPRLPQLTQQAPDAGALGQEGTQRSAGPTSATGLPRHRTCSRAGYGCQASQLATACLCPFCARLPQDSKPMPRFANSGGRLNFPPEAVLFCGLLGTRRRCDLERALWPGVG